MKRKMSPKKPRIVDMSISVIPKAIKNSSGKLDIISLRSFASTAIEEKMDK
jgi:hypothetical protein